MKKFVIALISMIVGLAAFAESIEPIERHKEDDYTIGIQCDVLDIMNDVQFFFKKEKFFGKNGVYAFTISDNLLPHLTKPPFYSPRKISMDFNWGIGASIDLRKELLKLNILPTIGFGYSFEVGYLPFTDFYIDLPYTIMFQIGLEVNARIKFNECSGLHVSFKTLYEGGYDANPAWKLIPAIGYSWNL